MPSLTLTNTTHRYAAYMLHEHAADILAFIVLLTTLWTVLGIIAAMPIPRRQMDVQMAEGQFRATHSNMVEYAEQVRCVPWLRRGCEQPIG